MATVELYSLKLCINVLKIYFMMLFKLSYYMLYVCLFSTYQDKSYEYPDVYHCFDVIGHFMIGVMFKSLDVSSVGVSRHGTDCPFNSLLSPEMFHPRQLKVVSKAPVGIFNVSLVLNVFDSKLTVK